MNDDNPAAPQHRILLAPMQGFTDMVFRNVYARHFRGIETAVAPFLPTGKGNRHRNRMMRELEPAANRAMAVTPQLMGNDPADFLAMAEHLAQLGYATVNWNLGCPYPMVARKFRGSGLLPFPDRIDRFLDTVMSRISCGLSIKMRLGRKTALEMIPLIPVLNRYPLTEIILHPRTGIQMYDGAPDLDGFARCAEAMQAELVYNGDVFCAADLDSLSRRFPRVRAWMLGRGVLMNPMLPEEILTKTPPGTDRLRRFRLFHDDLVDAYAQRLSGSGHLLERMKGFWTYFSRFFSTDPQAAKPIHRCRDIHRYREIVAALFQDCGPDDAGAGDGDQKFIRPM